MCFLPSLLHFGCPCPALSPAASLCSCQTSQMHPPLISLFFAGSCFSLFTMLAAAIKYAKSWNSQGCLELIEFGSKASKGQNLLPHRRTEDVFFQSRKATKCCRNSHQASQRTKGQGKSLSTFSWIKNSWEQQDCKGQEDAGGREAPAFFTWSVKINS